jgi:probable F420-dependent oxidoreductase
MPAIVPEGGWISGVQLPIQTLTRALADPWEADASVADLVRVARTAEVTGHSFVGVCDHVAIPDDDYCAQMTTTWYDTIATLGFLAGHTESIRLMSTVWIAAYRHPLQTASSFGTLDHLSGGRVILGIGAGHVEGEFRALGVPFQERGAILDETLEALEGVYRDRYVSFSGGRFSYESVGVAPQPADRRLTTWIGGNSPAAYRRVGRYGDGYIPMATPLTEYPRILDVIRRSAEDRGRGDARFDIGWMPGFAHLTGGSLEGMSQVNFQAPEALVERMRAAREIGINVFHIRFRGRSLADYLEQYDAYAEQVAPYVE